MMSLISFSGDLFRKYVLPFLLSSNLLLTCIIKENSTKEGGEAYETKPKPAPPLTIWGSLWRALPNGLQPFELQS